MYIKVVIKFMNQINVSKSYSGQKVDHKSDQKFYHDNLVKQVDIEKILKRNSLIKKINLLIQKIKIDLKLKFY